MRLERIQGRLRRLLFASLAAVMLCVAVPVAEAQSITAGSVRGKVGDETGASLPGVSITVSGSSLLATRTDVTDAEGNYRFLDLPVGSYKLVFELAGFQQFIREGIELSANFTATINVEMKIGSLEESVTVSGQSPVVDVTSTQHAVRVSGEYITKLLPGDRTMSDVMAVTPGVQMDTRPAMGRGAEAGSGGGKVFGVSGQVNPLVEGISTRQDANSTGNSPDLATAAEVQVVSVAGGASQATPGVAWNIVVKSGGNDFHGRAEASGQDKRFQDDNLPQFLKDEGIVTGDNLITSRDLSADLGGRIIRDKLWFYTAFHDLNGNSNNLGYSRDPGPDGVYITADDVPGTNLIENSNQTLKSTYQINSNFRLIGFITRFTSWVPERAGNRTNPRESLRSFWYDPTEFKGEFQGNLGTKFVFNVLSGKYSYFADYTAQPDSGATPSRTDRTSLLTLGPAISQDKRPRVNWQTTGSVTYFPETRFIGSHQLKSGFSSYTLWNGTGQPDGKHGNYFLTFDNGVAKEIRTYNYPLYPKNRMDEYGVYAEDSWRPSDRVTLNLGFRLDYFNTFVPEQTKEQGQFGGAGTFPRIDVNSWWAPAPRLGASYDIFGTGRTVLKASYGRFNHTPGDSFAQNFNPNTVQTVNYLWTDPNGNGDYDPGEVNLATNSNPAFISISSALNNEINPDLEIPRTYQYQATVEQELAHDLATSFALVRLRQSELYELVNVLRPYSAYNLPFQRIDPGPDGLSGTTATDADNGGPVTVYDYDPAYRGSAFVKNKFLNRESERDDIFTTLEWTLTKRMSSGWGGQATMSGTKYRQWRTGIVVSPNDLLFPLNDTWDWSWKLSLNKELPFGIGTSGSWTMANGVVGHRTFIFRSLPQSSTLTLPVEDYGVLKNPARGVVNLRATRTWRFGKGMSLRGAVDVLNLFNQSPPYAVSFASGPTFGNWSQILSPRILKGGVLFEF
jgi:hypothetical protein